MKVKKWKMQKKDEARGDEEGRELMEKGRKMSEFRGRKGGGVY